MVRNVETTREDIIEALEEEGIDCSGLSIEVEDGVVYLSGEVASNHQISLIERIISGFEEIEEIENNLTAASVSEEENALYEEFDDVDEEPMDTVDQLTEDEFVGTTDPITASDEAIPFVPPEKPSYSYKRATRKNPVEPDDMIQ